ncbi:MAG: hypothetical protein MI799_12385, partial [Desulfobacterales bacterium]|nr:hypothetical protein [Desulfobacterales bacterium]
PVKAGQLFFELSKYLKVDTRKDSESHDTEHGIMDPPGDQPPEIVKNLSELINAIDSDLMCRWQELQEVMPMKTVREFAKKIEALGKKHKAASLTQYGIDLFGYTNNFDVENMKIMVRRFPDVVNEFKLLGRSIHEIR